MRRTIQLRKTRSFGERLEGTFDFVRVTAKPLFKSLFFFTTPFVLIGTFLVTNLLNATFNLGGTLGTGVEDNIEDVMAIGLSAMGFLLLMAFAGSMIMAVVYSVFRCFEERGDADFTTNDVWKKVAKVYWQVFGTVLLYGVAFFVLYLIILVPFTLLLAFLSVLIIPVIYLLMGFFLIVMLTALPAQIYERKGIGKALNKAFQLLKGNWWSALGLFLILMLVYNAIIVVFSVPFYANMIFGIFSTGEVDLMADTPLWQKALNYLFGAILLLGSFMTYSLPLSGMTLQYFSFSEEKDARNLISRIDEFGKKEEEEDEGEF